MDLARNREDAMATTKETVTGQGPWEYVTYAPPGNRCSECRRAIKPFDVVRRGAMERPSGPHVVLYRHEGKCPGPNVAA